VFTGIIEESGTVKKLDLLKDSASLTIGALTVLENTLIGDSIAVNGVCLTVTDLSPGSFSVDIMYETLRKTNLQQLKQHSKVNLERALQLQTRLGGHLVSGHVDGIGKINAINKVGIAKVFEITVADEIISFLLAKGSIAIDGISLTLVAVEKKTFTVSLIPHTSKNTTLGFKGIGDTVNIETDIIGKYVARFLKKDQNSVRENPAQNDITWDFLSKNGFL